ncbi:carboxypeptidase regulatory-like domain-containing protein [uncultured Methanobacterium sp.]|uniref:carboxypeptidase regulatory-like domain-containing protein n=1 Tax=uncultured Methanobacterium sp. TaxID=176306 RepID=UPI002AA92535|nr:carboxypeptidase regulatory-like domain-containing protein [uncultured Methanobacterium sp.]
MKYKKRGAALLITFFLAVILCSAVCAAESNNDSISSTTDNSEIHSSATTVVSEENNSESSIDPIISGTVFNGSTDLGLGGVTIRVLDSGNNLMAETTTGADGSYHVNFNNPGTVFQVAAIRLGYLSYSKEITVTPNATNPSDPNLYGTANFRLYGLPAYSGNASSYVLNIGAIPGILLDIYAGKSSAGTDSQVIPYSEGEGIPLEIKLLGGDLLAGLLNVNSTGDQGLVTGGILPSNLPSILQLLGLNVGALVGVADSSTNPPGAIGGSSLVSLQLSLLNLIQIINLGVINANSSVTPDFNTGALTSSSSVGSTANILVLGGLLEIDALDVHATAVANGEAGGASAIYDWTVADIKLLGISILDQLQINGVVQIPGVLRIALGDKTETTSPDGTHAFASGDALNIELLNIIPGYELLTLTLGHAQAEARVPLGGLDVGTSDLGIDKAVNTLTPNYMDEVVFTLTAHNYGPDDATNVHVTDLLPAGFEWVSDDSNNSYNPANGVWNIGNLANGTNAVLHIVARVIASNTTITNFVSINGTEHDLEPGNDHDSVTVTVGPASDLQITKTVDNTTPQYLDTITYTITIHNNGPDNATGVTSTDTLPTGLQYISDDSNGSYNHNTGLWTIGTLTKNTNAILHIIAQVMASNTTITNIATVNGTNHDQNNTNNKTNTTITIGPASDLQITKTVDNTTPQYLDTITYTITIHNNGPDNATGVTSTDTLPTGLQYISDDGNGSYNHNTGLWTIGTLTKNTNAILHIIAQVMASNTTITNIATVNGTNHDQNNTNNKTNTTITIGPASDLQITKTVDNPTPQYLDTITYTITVHNNGPDSATNVVATDILPTGLRYIQDDSNNTYNPTTGIWTIGTLAKNTNAILHIIAQVMASNTTITNIATVNGTNYDQNNTNNKTNTTITIPPSSDLTITKTVNNPTPQYLETITYTITIHNNGPDNATGVTSTDILPTGLQYISDDGNGSYNHNTGLWTIGTLPKNTNTILHILAQVIVSNTTITNIATVNGTNHDQNNTNNKTNTTITIGPASDLGIAINVNDAHPKYLDFVEFTLSAHNYGPDNAPNAKVNFTAPAGLRYVSDDTNGSFNSTTGLWSIGYMAANTMAVMHLVMQAMVSNVQMTVEAVITDPDPNLASGFYDPNPDNNRATASVSPYSVSEPGNPTTKTTDSSSPTTSSEKTVGMQTTGIPLGGILMAILMIFTGISVSKRK